MFVCDFGFNSSILTMGVLYQRNEVPSKRIVSAFILFCKRSTGLDLGARQDGPIAFQYHYQADIWSSHLSSGQISGEIICWSLRAPNWMCEMDGIGNNSMDTRHVVMWFRLARQTGSIDLVSIRPGSIEQEGWSRNTADCGCHSGSVCPQHK